MSGTGSMMIRNLRRANDYDKARLNQDELLKIAIANDMNISNARRDYRRGEVPALTPKQAQTPDEIQQDISKNYTDAITNLLSLGMDYREASEIVTRLGGDPTNLQILNNTFPSIKADFQKRFDVKRTTATSFVDFFRKFREVFDETKGIADNSTLFNDKFDRIINNINDLRAITPSRDQINALRQSIQGQYRNIRNDIAGARGDIAGVGARDFDRDLGAIIGRLDRLAAILPSDRDYQRIVAGSDNTRTYQELAQIQNALANIPSRDQIQQILDRVEEGKISFDELSQKVKAIADSLEGTENPIYAKALPEQGSLQPGERLTPSELASRPPVPLGVDANISGTVYDSVGITNIGRGGQPRIIFNASESGASSAPYNRKLLRVEIDKSPALQSAVRKFTGENWAGTQENRDRIVAKFFHEVENDLQNPRKVGLVLKSSSSDIDWRDIDAGASSPQVANAEDWRKSRSRSASVESNPPVAKKVGPGGGGRKRDEGSGLKGANLGHKGQILIKKIGRGIAPVDEPSHIEFGKHLLHANNLKKGVLSIHHKGGGRVASIPVQNISEDLRDFIVDTLRNSASGRVGASQKDFGRLPIQEQKLFERFATGAGVFHNLGLRSVQDDDDKKNLERFEVLRGEWMAGNNSHELIRELRKLVIHFMEEKRLTKSQARELLLNLA